MTTIGGKTAPALFDSGGGSATSYAEAEAGGFTINTNDPVGAKVAAVFLPVSDTVWQDVVNGIDGTLLGGVTIGQDSIGRFAEFDGVDSIIDMGQPYTTGPNPIIPNWRTTGNPCAALQYSFFDFASITDTAAAIFAESDGLTVDDTQIIVYYGGDGDGSFRMLRNGGRRILGTGAIPTQQLMTTGVNIASSTDMRGYVNGVGSASPDNPSPESPVTTNNLTIGAANATERSFKFPGRFYQLPVANQDINDAEQILYNANPWRIFRV